MRIAIALAFICALPASAQTVTPASPALPWLSSQGASGIDATGATPSTAGLNVLFGAVPSSGGAVYVTAGTYSVGSALAMKAGTQIICQPGATFKAAASWTGSKMILANANHAAGSITDHDMTVDGCGFDATLHPGDGAFHAIDFRMARHVRVSRVACSGGGDCTAMQATDDTIISDSYATGMFNACWDHWEAPTNGVVRHNQCGSALYGILVTGTDTAQALTGMAAHFRLTGNAVVLTAAGAGIWLNGLGPAGSGASFVDATDNDINVGAFSSPCIKVSGGGKDNTLGNTVCTGGAATTAILSASDTGGTPSVTRIRGGIIDGYLAAATPLIALSGTGDDVEGVKVVGGTYTYGVAFTGTGQFAAHNRIPAGSSGVYSTGTATVIDP